jgi:hypothetical protein
VYDLGSTVPLGTTIADADGLPTAAVGVACTVSWATAAGPPATATPAVTSPSTGLYTADFVPTSTGIHTARWTSTAPVTVSEQTFDVQPSLPMMVSLTDAKDHLNKIAPDDDDELRPFVATATQVVEDHLGQAVVPRIVVDERECITARSSIALTTPPVMSLVSVVTVRTLGVPAWTYNVADLRPSPAGVLEVVDGHEFYGRVVVTYWAGRTVVPPRYRSAALAIISDLWRSQRPDTGGRRPSPADASVITRSDGRPFQVRDFPTAERLLGLGTAGFA